MNKDSILEQDECLSCEGYGCEECPFNTNNTDSKKEGKDGTKQKNN